MELFIIDFSYLHMKKEGEKNQRELIKIGKGISIYPQAENPRTHNIRHSYKYTYQKSGAIKTTKLLNLYTDFTNKMQTFIEFCIE